MTVNVPATDLEQGNSKKSSLSAKGNKSVKKRLKKAQKLQKPPRKRLTFLEAWKNAVTTDAERKAKQHFCWTEDEAFNELVRRFGENFFEVIEKGNTPTATWETYQHIIPPRNLLSLYQDPKKVVGLRFGTLTRIFLLDVDMRSPVHGLINKAEFDRLLLTLEQMGLARYHIIRSSDSGGLHIVIGLNESLPTWMSANTLHVMLTKAGFKIGNGILELFPNRKQYNPNEVTSYQGIRLPLQPDSGSVVLDSVTLEPIHTDLNRLVRELAHDAENQDLETFKHLMRIAYEDFRIDHKGRVKARTGRGQAWHNDMLERIKMGFTASGQTNDLTLEVGKVVFVFHKQEGQAAVDEMVAWIKSLPGYTEHCHHQHEIEHRCWEWHKCIKKLYYKYNGTWRPRLGLRYGETIQAIAARLEDGRRHNPANATRQQEAEKRLAATIWKIRQGIRQGLIIAPSTLTGWMKLLIAQAKELFETGFSFQFLGRFKGLLKQLQAFALRVTRRAALVEESTPVEPEVTEATQDPVEQFPLESLVVEVTQEPVVPQNPACEALEPARNKELRAFIEEQATLENLETRTEQGITGFSPIYEGGGGTMPPAQGATVPVVAPAVELVTPVVSSSPSALPSFLKIGEKVKFQHETTAGWRKGTIVKINFIQGYFVNCVVQFYNRQRNGEWVSRLVEIYNDNWIKPLGYSPETPSPG